MPLPPFPPPAVYFATLLCTNPCNPPGESFLAKELTAVAAKHPKVAIG